jgi:hypothetical protein
MKIRGDEPFLGLKNLCKNVWNTWNLWRVTQNLTMNDISKFKYFCFATILDMSLISRPCKNDHIIFNSGTPSLEARNIRLVNIITYIIEESKLISENMIYIDDIIHNCMCVIFWTWKWYIESSWIKWNKN